MKQDSKQAVYQFIKSYFKDKADDYFYQLSQFVDLLWEYNQKVNLISRKMPKEEYWSKHIYDSIQLLKIKDFTHLKVIDFGSGGGLPGIPIKILFPSAKMYLLDSKLKKMNILEKIVKVLDLKSCFTIVSRIEEIQNEWFDQFDCLLCRSVRIEKKYKENMMKLIHKKGTILLLKGRKLDDLDIFSGYRIQDVSHALLGERKIIEIKRKL